MQKIRQYWLRNATFANSTKTAINGTLETVNDETGETKRIEMIINKHDKHGNLSSDWKRITNHVGYLRIIQNTEKLNAAQKKKEQKLRSLKKDQEASKNLEELFQSKLTAMEIDEVKECKDRKLKSRIRRAKTPIEVAIFAAVAAMNAEDEEKPSTPKKKTTRKKTTSKKNELADGDTSNSVE